MRPKEKLNPSWCVLFLRLGQKTLKLGQTCIQAQCSTLREVKPLASAASPIPLLPNSLFCFFSPYCPLTHFPQCYKLQTTQTSRPNALLWMPSKLHFLPSQEAGFIDNTGHTVRLFIYWQGKRPKTGPPQAQKTPALFAIS